MFNNASSDCFFRRVACHGIAKVRRTNRGMACALGKGELEIGGLVHYRFPGDDF